MGKSHLGIQVSVLLLASVAISAQAVGQVADPNPPTRQATCSSYDRYLPRTEAVLIQNSTCDSAAPELGGLRPALAEHGVGIGLTLRPSYTYDLLQNNGQGTQSYNGQYSTRVLGAELKLTYDLGRWGWGGDAQFIAGFTSQSSNYRQANPAFASMNTFAISQRFATGRVELQYGYYELIREYYGMVLGGNSSSAALGPSSVIPVQLGLTLYTPSPALTLTLKDVSQRWYNRFSVGRSASPGGLQHDLDLNPSGFRLKVPGSGMVAVDEFGYKTPLMASGKSQWARVGVIYNSSDYSDLKSGGTKQENYGGYAAFTTQLTQPRTEGPGGLYLDIKGDYAPADRNLYATDVQLTTFYIGPFASRPADMLSLGYSKSNFSKYMRRSMEELGSSAEASTTAVSISYAAHVSRGLYWINALTYQQAPTFTPKTKDVLLFQTLFNISF